ncbi:enoyl-CoA hydratase/isomerase family protein [Cupriavidus basilensis]|uniref:enoyl-CoA hydratase/isomerase family protein n=1 Tax=Cupriavidus TaxID=106589 RepID=UPI00044B02C9|nr:MULTISPECIES: enoyl-CoA hydratase/isomerase family protein [Cupriavidus]KDP88480.1 enoyl-CoA hydratase [Cupriavidus sp. SK-3]MDF3885033.1 enoyl-CoA hydratase/isomerase family protein [Cupriavidus basilensis]
MSDNTVLLEKVGGTAVITLNRPHRRNALDDSIKAAMADIVSAVREDRSVSAVVLTGAGGNFCAGADLGDGGADAERGFYVRDLLLDHHGWFTELTDLEKPVISAVDGFATGAGLSVALAADFIIASDRARFVSSFARVGFVPDLSLMYVLPRRVGLVRAKEIVFSAREIQGEEAVAIGLAEAVVPADRLRDAAIEFAQRFEKAPTHVLGMAKRIMNRTFETDRHALLQLEAAVQGLCAASQYNAEAVRRFFSKEAPLFPGTQRLF